MLQLPFGRYWKSRPCLSSRRIFAAAKFPGGLSVSSDERTRRWLTLRGSRMFHCHFRKSRRIGDRSDAGVGEGVDICVHPLAARR